MKNQLTNKILNQLLELSPESKSGLRWRKRPSYLFNRLSDCKRFNFQFAGKDVGCEFYSGKSNTMYWRMTINYNGFTYSLLAHRIVYALYHELELTEFDEIDHEDGNGLNNSIDNLRDCGSQQNKFNTKIRKTNKTGYTGVRKTKFGKYEANISIDGKSKYLGTFSTIEKASAAYKEAALKHHGEFISKHL